jgi:predicted transcriptional regulator
MSRQQSDHMTQLTLRLPDDLLARLKAAARARRQSVNGLATAVLGAAIDPSYAGDEVLALRERLARAGLLMVPTPGRHRRPDPAALRRARVAAGRGRPLSRLVGEGRT